MIPENAGSVSPSPRFAIAKWGEGRGEVLVFILRLEMRGSVAG
jgi:hypothetical protein